MYLLLPLGQVYWLIVKKYFRYLGSHVIRHHCTMVLTVFTRLALASRTRTTDRWNRKGTNTTPSYSSQVLTNCYEKRRRKLHRSDVVEWRNILYFSIWPCRRKWNDKSITLLTISTQPSPRIDALVPVQANLRIEMHLHIIKSDVASHHAKPWQGWCFKR